MYVFTYLQIHVWNLRLAFGSSVLIKKGKSMGLWIHLFLELIKIQEEIKTKLNRKATKVGEIFTTYTELSFKHIQNTWFFVFLKKKKKVLKKNPVTDFASWTKSNIFLSKCS